MGLDLILSNKIVGNVMSDDEKADNISAEMKKIISACLYCVDDEIEFKVQLFISGYYDLKKELDVLGFELPDAP